MSSLPLLEEKALCLEVGIENTLTLLLFACLWGKLQVSVHDGCWPKAPEGWTPVGWRGWALIISWLTLKTAGDTRSNYLFRKEIKSWGFVKKKKKEKNVCEQK